jgi:hypothetical protein
VTESAHMTWTLRQGANTAIGATGSGAFAQGANRVVTFSLTDWRPVLEVASHGRTRSR